MKWFVNSLEVGTKLCTLLSEYMQIYIYLLGCFKNKEPVSHNVTANLIKLKEDIKKYSAFVSELDFRPVCPLGGASVRMKRMGDELTYYTDIMLSSIKTNKRIPDNVRALPQSDWW